MILTHKPRRVLYVVLTPFILLGIVGCFVGAGENGMGAFMFSAVVAACLWADGLGGPNRRRYGRLGLLITAPWLLLSLVMLTGIYEYQGSYVHVRFGNGLIKVHIGSTAALAPMRWPKSSYVHGNWVLIPRFDLRSAGLLAQSSLETILSSPQSTLFGSNMTNSAGVPIDYLEIPVTALLVWTGLPTVMLRVGRQAQPLRPGHCNQCGYDLTGNTSGVCPECGHVLPATTTQNGEASTQLA